MKVGDFLCVVTTIYMNMAKLFRRIGENSFEAGGYGSTGTINYSTGYGTPAGGNVMQNPDKFKSSNSSTQNSGHESDSEDTGSIFKMPDKPDRKSSSGAPIHPHHSKIKETLKILNQKVRKTNQILFLLVMVVNLYQMITIQIRVIQVQVIQTAMNLRVLHQLMIINQKFQVKTTKLSQVEYIKMPFQIRVLRLQIKNLIKMLTNFLRKRLRLHLMRYFPLYSMN